MYNLALSCLLRSCGIWAEVFRAVRRGGSVGRTCGVLPGESGGSVGFTNEERGALLPILLIAGGIYAYQNGILDNIIGGGVEIIGEGESQFMVTGGAKPEVEKCTKGEMVQQRKCRMPVLIVDAATMPYIARNVKLAWQEGRPGILHREEDPVKQKANRKAACPRAVKRALSGSCDEFPLASTKEGGEGARVEGVPMEEQCAQGWVVMETARVNNMKDGDPFAVIIVNPSKIATDQYSGGMWLGDQLNC